MQAMPLSNATRTLATDQPEYGSLDVLDIKTQLGNAMVSVWRPTEQERQQLINGGELQLSVLGTVHPPVELVVTGGETNVR